MRLMPTTCLICGKAFNAIPYCLRTGRGRFCSRSCANVERNKAQRKGITAKCGHCRKEIYRTPDQIKQKHLFCSSKCWGLSKCKKQISTCEICGKKFLIKISTLKKGYGKICSLRCHGVHTSNRQKKEMNPCWKGGITPDHIKIRSLLEYKEWRKKVLERDGFTCQKCGDNKNKNNHAHHVKRFSAILDDIRQKFPLLFIVDMAQNYAKMWDIKNGITLCEPCHKEEHKKAVA